MKCKPDFLTAVNFDVIKIAVGIGFLENAVTSVLFILDDAANATGGPVAAFLGRNLLLVQFFGDGLCAFPGKKLSKDAFYDFCLRRIYEDPESFAVRPNAVKASVTISDVVARSSPDAAARFMMPSIPSSMSEVFHPAMAM